MRLKTLKIENFRGIVSLQLDLGRATVLIGENNTGKTTILDALHTCMYRGLTRRAQPFSEYDFHLTTRDAVLEDGPPIILTLTFEESTLNEWPDEVVQAFPNTLQLLADGRQCLILRVTGRYDKALRDFAVDWCFLDGAGNPLAMKRDKQLYDLQSLSPVFLLTPMREASQHFQPRGTFWSPFTKNPQFPDDQREEIEQQIEQLNQSVLDSHKPFDEVKQSLSKAGALLPLATKDVVSIEAVPARIADVLARTEVKLGARTGARLPITEHGSGAQSLAVMFLFEAFLQARLADGFDVHAEPILALEEPEAHLHPSATRALWSVLDEFPGQKVIATHSGDLLSAVPLTAIRRLARKDGTVQVFQLDAGALDTEETEKVAFHVRAKRGSLFFARCWLLVEGQSEFTVLPELARLLRIDFELQSVSCVEFSNVSLPPLIKTAQALGIEWHVLADGDPAGEAFANTACQFVGTEPRSERVTRLIAANLEQCFWDAGYGPVYEAEVDAARKHLITSAPGAADYSRQVIKAARKSTSKPHLACVVAAEAVKRGPAAVPPDLRKAIEAAVALAERSR